MIFEDNKSTNRFKTVLSKDVQFKGRIEFTEALEIKCQFNGEIQSPQGNLIVEKNGCICAKIEINSLESYGCIEGNVQSHSEIYLKQGSLLIGNIQTKNLQMDLGSILQGQCDMQSPLVKKDEKQDTLSSKLKDALGNKTVDTKKNH